MSPEIKLRHENASCFALLTLYMLGISLVGHVSCALVDRNSIQACHWSTKTPNQSCQKF